MAAQFRDQATVASTHTRTFYRYPQPMTNMPTSIPTPDNHEPWLAPTALKKCFRPFRRTEIWQTSHSIPVFLLLFEPHNFHTRFELGGPFVDMKNPSRRFDSCKLPNMPTKIYQNQSAKKDEPPCSPQRFLDEQLANPRPSNTETRAIRESPSLMPRGGGRRGGVELLSCTPRSAYI